MVASGKDTLRTRYKTLRKKLLAFMPMIRRSRHSRTVARMEKHLAHERKANEGMGRLFFAPPPLASAVPCAMPVPIKDEKTAELCLFVTHAGTADLKPHVVDHIEALTDSGIAVVLIANADVEASSLRVPPQLAERLYGCLVRPNVGLDFAAWGHAYCLLPAGAARSRIYLINDSIVGPLDRSVYATLLQRVRNSPADIVGLTSNPDPHPHLQSYYLVFNERVLHSPVYDSFMRGIVNMPLKQNVIDCYEIWLSPFLEQQGFTTAAIFPNLSKLAPPRRNDTVLAWRQLVDLGFPFIKSMVLRDPLEGEDARRLLPERYLEQ